jgi:hypothetical protein
MNYQLTFSALCLYDAGESGITVPAVSRLGLQEMRLEAKVDTGSSYCIFQRGYGEHLGLDIESGHRQTVGTAVGSFTVYGHPVTLSVKDFDFDVVAYFAADYVFTRNVLGRHGFLNRLRIGLIDYAGKLYLGSGGEGDAEG